MNKAETHRYQEQIRSCQGEWKGKKQVRDMKRYKLPVTKMEVMGTKCRVGVQSLMSGLCTVMQGSGDWGHWTYHGDHSNAEKHQITVTYQELT